GNGLLFSDALHEMLEKGNIKIIFSPCLDVGKMVSGIAIYPNIPSFDTVLCIENPSISCSVMSV
ncbi:hypothetical protein Q8G48_28185, partial [Klebsiella pneumoniae]|uniref:hypothetical protein n=1 Tax=Klebsiella pneumoniae TaxID=573 RepID=UPI0030141464